MFSPLQHHCNQNTNLWQRPNKKQRRRRVQLVASSHPPDAPGEIQQGEIILPGLHQVRYLKELRAIYVTETIVPLALKQMYIIILQRCRYT